MQRKNQRGVLEARVQAKERATARADGIAGEEASEVNHVEAVVEVAPIGLQGDLDTIARVECRSERCVDGKLRADATAFEVDAADDSRPVLCKRFGFAASEFERKTG